jgi:hypothetical protein
VVAGEAVDCEIAATGTAGLASEAHDFTGAPLEATGATGFGATAGALPVAGLFD